MNKITSAAIISHPGQGARLSIVADDREELSKPMTERALVTLIRQASEALDMLIREKGGKG